MKEKRLLHLVEQINEIYIAEAAPKSADVAATAPVQKKAAVRPVWVRWSAIAAAFVLLLGAVIGGYSIFQKITQGNRPDVSEGNNDGNASYMDYNGPVLPLTILQDVEGIVAERVVSYDFSHEAVTGKGKAYVTDQYILHNTAEEAKTVSLVYPFGASLSDDVDVLPQVTVGGVPMETSLYPGAESKLKKSGKTGEKIGWEAYQALLQDGSYMDGAFAAYPELHQSVVVYEITDTICHGKGENPTLSLEFQMDYNQTTVMTYGMNGAKNDVQTGTYSRSFSVPEVGEYGYGESSYLVVLGEDLASYTLQGYKDGGCDKGDEIEITANVSRIETTLGAFLQERLEEKRIPANSSGEIRDAVSEEQFFGLVAQQMQDSILTAEGTAKFNYDILEDVISSAHYAQRVIYLTFDVTIPAGEQITVDCGFVKAGHSDYMSSEQNGIGYDVATQLGSGLVFTSQEASVVNGKTIQILEQNFGFALGEDVTQAVLQNDEAYYWMEVREQ